MKIVSIHCLLPVLLLIHFGVRAQEQSVPFTAAKPPSTYSSPVSISNFVCTFQQQQVRLAWTCVAGQGIDRFVVERSKDGKHFEMAGIVFTSDDLPGDEYRFSATRRSAKDMYRIKAVRKEAGGDAVAAIQQSTIQK